jgi:hypothetical protein
MALATTEQEHLSIANSIGRGLGRMDCRDKPAMTFPLLNSLIKKLWKKRIRESVV